MERANELRSVAQRRAEESESVRAGIDALLGGPYTLNDANLWYFKKSEDRERLRDGLKLAGVPEAGENEKVSLLEVPGAITVDVELAKALFDRGVTFIDVLPDNSWRDGHIPGAIHLDFKDAFTEASLSAVVDRGQEVVIYCLGPRCLRSSEASARAVSWGFKKVYYFREGLPAWKAAGYPINVP
jgi:rhodanese-related sulfurtransferase